MVAIASAPSACLSPNPSSSSRVRMQKISGPFAKSYLDLICALRESHPRSILPSGTHLKLIWGQRQGHQEFIWAGPMINWRLFEDPLEITWAHLNVIWVSSKTGLKSFKLTRGTREVHLGSSESRIETIWAHLKLKRRLSECHLKKLGSSGCHLKVEWEGSDVV